MKIKLSEQEIQEIKDLERKIDEVIYKIGENSLVLTALDNEIEIVKKEKQELLKEYSGLLQQDKKKADEITSKYGKGTINIDTGEFEKE